MRQEHCFTLPWRHTGDHPIEVTVVGCGGTGGEVIDMLARLHFCLMGLGHRYGFSVTLIDGDRVSESNVGRQRFTPSDVGYNKAELLAGRYNIAYGLEWTAIPAMFDDKSMLRGTDLVISCVDNAASRVLLHDAFRSRDYGHDELWLDFGNNAHAGQAVLGASAPQILPTVVDLFPNLRTDPEPDDGPSCGVAEALRRQAFGVNRLLVAAGFGSILAPLFTKGSITQHGVFTDLSTGTTRALPIDPEAWAFLSGGAYTEGSWLRAA